VVGLLDSDAGRSEVGAGAVDVGAGVEALDGAEQRLFERASAACRSADVHLLMRHEPATAWKEEVQRQAVSVSPLQPCLATAS